MKNLTKMDITDIDRMSQIVSKSPLVPPAYQGNPASCLVAIVWGQEIGLNAMQSLQNIAVINGKPSLYGDALLALTRSDKRCVGVEETNTDGVAKCVVKRRHIDGSIEEIVRTFSMADAKKANLLNKKGPWQEYPDRMLQARARGFALRDAFPDVLKGLISVEEAEDHPKTDKIVTVKPVQSTKVTPEGMITNEKAEGSAEGSENSKDEGVEYIINLPNGKTRVFQDLDQWAINYAEVMQMCVDFDGFENSVKRTKLKELEDTNKHVLHNQLPDEIREELLSKRINYNKYLGAKENG